MRWLNAVLTSSKTGTEWINTGFMVLGSIVGLDVLKKNFCLVADSPYWIYHVKLLGFA